MPLEPMSHKQSIKLFTHKHTHPEFTQNHILSQNLRKSIHTIHRNGGDRVVLIADEEEQNNYIAANILQVNSNFIVPDETGVLYRTTQQCLKNHGYTIQILDCANPEKGMSYYPLEYIDSEEEIELLSESFKSCENHDSLLEIATKTLFALCLYYAQTLPMHQRRFAVLYDILRESENVIGNIQNERALEYYQTWNTTFWYHQNQARLHLLKHFEDLMSSESRMSGPAFSFDEFDTSRQAIFVLSGHDAALSRTFYTQVLYKLQRSSEHPGQRRLQRPVLIAVHTYIPSIMRHTFELEHSNIDMIFAYNSLSTIQKQYSYWWHYLVGLSDALIVHKCSDNVTAEYIAAIPWNKKYRGSLYHHPLHCSASLKQAVVSKPEDEYWIYIPSYYPIKDNKFHLMSHPHAEYLQ